jgi:hypothetical protein
MKIGRLRRVGYSFLGLLSGNAVLTLWYVADFVRHAMSHPGSRPWVPEFSWMFQMSCIYFAFMVAGWLLVGVPFAIGVSTEMIQKMSWWIVVVGAIAGPVSLWSVFLLSGIKLNPGRWREASPLIMYPGIAGLVTGAVYYGLMLRRLRKAG